MPRITYGPVDEALMLLGARASGLEEIRPGATFRVYHYGTGFSWELHITGTPKRDADGRLLVEVEARVGPGAKWLKAEIDLAEFGLDPSLEESWDEERWLVGSHICV